MTWLARKLPTPAPVLSLPPVKLTAQRVYLRPPVLSDWSSWARVRRDNYHVLETLEPTWPEGCLSEEFFERRLKRQAQDWHARTAYSFIIFLQDNTLIGGINLNHVAHGAVRSASLGYWLDEKYQGQGYMHEALATVIGYAFSELNLHRMNGACLPHNTKSMDVLRALGFAEEGFAKSYYRINGEWQDHVLFGLVRPE